MLTARRTWWAPSISRRWSSSIRRCSTRSTRASCGAGYAEVVKYGLIDDPAFFDWCEQNGRALLEGDQPLRQDAIAHCIAAKQRLIEGDLDDRNGQRTLLNLGHSFAHAIEAEAGLGVVLHGEAVAVGLVLAFGLSASLGHCPTGEHDRVAAHLSSVGLPTSLAQVGLAGSTDRLTQWLADDKKNRADGLSLILVNGIGRAFVCRGVDGSSVAVFLRTAA